jgi:DNA polymerase-3 subunit delta'
MGREPASSDSAPGAGGPGRLAELRGNAAVGRALSRAVGRGLLPHALLLHGPEGSGRRHAAKLLAALLCCESPEGGEPCGRCGSCRRVLSGSHPDVAILEAEGSSLKIEEIHQLVGRMRLRPAEGRAQVFALLGAERLTPEAANALLKSLEEPPSAVTWILTAPSPAAVLPTIASRCIPLAFRLPGGGPIRASSEAEIEARQKVLAALAAAVRGELHQALAFAREQARGREAAAAVIDDLVRLLRDRALLACAAEPSWLADPELAEALDRELAALRPELAARLALQAEEAADQLRRNANPALLLDALFIAATGG